MHSKHPRQARMLALARLASYQHIHSEIVAQAQVANNVSQEVKIYSLYYQKITYVHWTHWPNPTKKSKWILQDLYFSNIKKKQNIYMLVTFDRLSRFPHAEIYNNCDTNTALEYLESYCKLHGIQRSIRCDQAQAFKSKWFKIFCENKNIRLILAPAGDQSGTGMVWRLIQAKKSGTRHRHQLIKHNFSKPINKHHRKYPAHTQLHKNKSIFGSTFRKKMNRELFNTFTKPSRRNLTYQNLTKKCLDKKLLPKNTLTLEEIWRRKGDSEDELDNRYREDIEDRENNQDVQKSKHPSELPSTNWYNHPNHRFG